MNRQIQLNRGALTRETNDLTRQLKAIIINFRSGLVTKEQAKEKARRLIDRQYDVLLRLSRDRLRVELGRLVEVPPEELARLNRWKKEYFSDFEKILDDEERALIKKKG